MQKNTYITDIKADTVIAIAAGKSGDLKFFSSMLRLPRNLIPQYEENNANTNNSTAPQSVKKFISANNFSNTDAKTASAQQRSTMSIPSRGIAIAAPRNI